MLVSNQLHGFNRAKPRFRWYGGPDLDDYAGSWAIRDDSGLKSAPITYGSGNNFYVGPPSPDKCVIITNFAKFGSNNTYLSNDFYGAGAYQLAIVPTLSTSFTNGLGTVSYLTVSRRDPDSSTMICYSIGTRMARIPYAEYLTIGARYYKTKTIAIGSGEETNTIAVDTVDYPVYTDFEAMTFYTFNYEGDVNTAALYGYTTTTNTGGSLRVGVPGSIVYSASAAWTATTPPAVTPPEPDFSNVLSDVPSNQWQYYYWNSDFNSFFFDTDSSGIEYGLATAIFSPNSYNNRIYSPVWSGTPSPSVVTQTMIYRP